MPATFITEPGSPEAIQVGELPVPVSGPDGRARRRRGVGDQPGQHLHPVQAIPDPLPPPFVGSPEVYTVGELARGWFKQHGMHRAIIPLWLPGKTAGSLRQGGNTYPQQAT